MLPRSHKIGLFVHSDSHDGILIMSQVRSCKKTINKTKVPINGGM